MWLAFDPILQQSYDDLCLCRKETSKHRSDGDVQGLTLDEFEDQSHVVRGRPHVRPGQAVSRRRPDSSPESLSFLHDMCPEEQDDVGMA